MAVMIIRVYAFGCDASGCERWSNDYVPTGNEPQKAAWSRKQATADGWRFKRGRAFCPFHVLRGWAQ
jgi:hypothetical protein